MKNIIASIYLGIGFIYTLYSYFFTYRGIKGFAYNIGVGLAWPITMFPSFGKFLGGIIILAMVCGIFYASMKNR